MADLAHLVLIANLNIKNRLEKYIEGWGTGSRIPINTDNVGLNCLTQSFCGTQDNG